MATVATVVSGSTAETTTPLDNSTMTSLMVSNAILDKTTSYDNGTAFDNMTTTFDHLTTAPEQIPLDHTASLPDVTSVDNSTTPSTLTAFDNLTTLLKPNISENFTKLSNMTASSPIYYVYTSTLEQWSFILLTLLFFVGTMVGQSAIILTIKRTLPLHTIHFYLIFAFCISDMVYSLDNSLIALTQFVLNTFPRTACRVMSAISILTVYGNRWHLAVIAYERYYYFCRAIHYVNRVTVVRMGVAVAAGYAASFIFILYTELNEGRVYQPCLLSCVLANVSTLESMSQLLVFSILPTTITIVCAVAISRLSRRLNRVVPGEVSGSSRTEQASTSAQARKTFKMILLVTGTNLLLFVPAFIINRVVLAAGYSLDDLNSRRYPAVSHLMRTAIFFYSPVPMLLNPVIYLGTRPELRDASKKIVSAWLGRRSEQGHELETSAQ